MLHLFLRPTWGAGITEAEMDATKRKITKIAREVSKFTVRKNPGITQAGVCRITGLDKGAVARQTANLEAKGYLERRENPGDGRSRLLYATEKAESLKNSKAQIETAFYEWLAQPLSDAEREEFARVLDVLYRRCKAESKADFPEMSAIMKDGVHDEK